MSNETAFSWTWVLLPLLIFLGGVFGSITQCRSGQFKGVFRLGRFHSLFGPGLHLRVPFIDKVEFEMRTSSASELEVEVTNLGPTQAPPLERYNVRVQLQNSATFPVNSLLLIGVETQASLEEVMRNYNVDRVKADPEEARAATQAKLNERLSTQGVSDVVVLKLSAI